MLTKAFRFVERGDVFRFIETGCILAKVGERRVLVCDPCEELEDERGKIVSLVDGDMDCKCAIINLKKRFYK